MSFTENNNTIILLYYGIGLGLLLLLTCTTDSPVNPGLGESQFITVSLNREGITEAQYDGTRLDMIIKFSDSVFCDFNSIIKIHWIDGRFYVPDETFLNKKLKKVSIPIYWINKSLLPIDSTTNIPYDSIYVQVGLSKSNILRVDITNLAPYIDSLVVGDSSFIVIPRTDTIQTFSYYVDSASDVPLKLIAGDLDGPSVKATWENQGPNYFLLWNPIKNPKLATYKLRNENFRDVITAVVYDTDASVQVKLKLCYLDGSELIIDSLSYKDKYNTFIFRDTTAMTYSINGYQFDTATIRIYPRIIGGRALWSTSTGIIKNGQVNDTTNYIITYIFTQTNLNEPILTDTIEQMDLITLLYKNSLGDDSITKSITINKIPRNQRPVFDYIYVDTVKYINFNNMYYIINAGKTIPLKALAHDPEGGAAGGTIVYTWFGKTTGSLTGFTGDSISYIASFNPYIDTISITASDSLGFKKSETIILACNNRPVIDTLFVDNAPIIPTSVSDTVFYYVKVAPDTFNLRVSAHDIDSHLVDTVTGNVWQYRNVNLQQVTSTKVSIDYICADNIYKDTVTIYVSDKYLAIDKRKLIFTFLR